MPDVQPSALRDREAPPRTLGHQPGRGWGPPPAPLPPVPAWTGTPRTPASTPNLVEPTASRHHGHGTGTGDHGPDTHSDSSRGSRFLDGELPPGFEFPLPYSRYDPNCSVYPELTKAELGKVRLQDGDLLSQTPTSNTPDPRSASSSSLSGSGSRARSASPQTPPDCSRRRVGSEACGQDSAGPGYNGAIWYERVGYSGIPWHDYRVLINEKAFVWSPAVSRSACEDHLHASSHDQIVLKLAGHVPGTPASAVGGGGDSTQGVARVRMDLLCCMQRCMTTDPAICLPALAIAWRATGVAAAHRYTASALWVRTYVAQPGHLNTSPDAHPYCNSSLHYRVSRPWGLPLGSTGPQLDWDG